jgi:hypothetical protein
VARVDIMTGLALVIDCLCFFFHFSFLIITKVHNYSMFICYLLGSDMDCQTQATWVWHPRHPNSLGLTTMFDVRPGRGLAFMHVCQIEDI